MLYFLFALLITWYDPMTAGFSVIQNQGFIDEIEKSYYRLPDRYKDIVKAGVWEQSRLSASLSVHFVANTDTIQIQLETEKPYSFANMAPLGANGIDLYAVDNDGIMTICAGTYNFGSSAKNSISFTFSDLKLERYQYRLFLPPFDVVKSLKIGVTDGSEFRFNPTRCERPIVAYGTSVVQGLSANRPALGWLNWLSRELDFPVLNFGFMGQGTLDKTTIDAMIDNNAQVYLIDCLSDLVWQPVDKVVELLMSSYSQIRAKWSETPIVFIEFPGYTNQVFDLNNMGYFENMNKASKKAYDNLIKQGANNLYYINANELNIQSDDMTDSLHLSDLGMKKQTTVVVDRLRKILSLELGERISQQPFTENWNIDFHNRFNDIIKYVQKKKPKNVVLGDSITNTWGGEPRWPWYRGEASWNEFMEPKGFINYGVTSDAIENALYRVYHDSFFNMSVENVVSLLGTNNFKNTDDEGIVEGLRFLFRQVRIRQPKANIIICGVLPRTTLEKRIVGLNNQIKQMVEEEGWTFIDPGQKLVLEDGTVNPIYFENDKLHLINVGYRQIAPDIINALI